MNFVSSHWGTYNFSVDKNKKIQLDNWGLDSSPTEFGLGLADAAIDNLRITQPHVRKGWLNNIGKSDGKRGQDEFIPVSWDEAFELASKELLKTKNVYGNSAIYAGSYGWASAGRFHHAKSQVNRFFNLFGGFSSSFQSYSYAAAQTLLPHIIGLDLYTTLEEHTTWNALSEECELILMFGGMPLKNSKVSAGGVGKHVTKLGIKKCFDKGVEFINISPLIDDAPKFLKAQQVPIRPNTDTALMLALAHILIKNQSYDKDFIEKYTVGFDSFSDYVQGKKNNQECSPEWASKITNIPVKTIYELANKIITKKTMISLSWSLQRASRGEQPLWMGITLAAMLGQIGTASGGFGFGYSSVNSTGDSFDKIPWQSLPQGKNKIKDFIPVARVTDMLENPGGEFDYDGKKLTYPDIKLIYWAGGNPFHHHQDLNRLTKAWQKPNTIIVNEIWWNSQARHADIIFPANTALERNDLMLNPRDPTVVANKKAMKSYKNSKTDFEIFSGLSKKLGFLESFTEDKSELDWIKFIWNNSSKTNQKNISFPSFEEFWEKGYFELPAPKIEKIMFNDFRKDPINFPLKTPSGKIEISSETISNFQLSDCFSHPYWFEPYEWLGNIDEYPLHLISNQPTHRLHSQLDNAANSQNSKIKGKEPVMINPSDALERDIQDGDIVMLFNKRGRVLAGANISDSVMPGVVVLSTGAWFDPDYALNLERHGNPNVLTKDVGTSSLSQGPTCHTTLVQVKKAKREEIVDVNIFKTPETLN
ncbi:molybdopterin-dependent oxidoreductase [Candidatus Thioglobus sp.]|nr:molybdopterin-dependent oxidoreductase [Candidatus Thioglobus sp.]MDC1536650.1 molybdopterin-dependent oxidoreductase [Candidatus Thioglobus sp.]